VGLIGLADRNALTKMSFPLGRLFGQDMALMRFVPHNLASACLFESLCSGTVRLNLRHSFSFSTPIYPLTNTMATKIYVNPLNNPLMA
jgi:hypothetical protein